MYHMFDTDVAKTVGVNAAILFQNIAFWCEHSEANGVNFHDGNYWTYSSVSAFLRIFTYMGRSQIETALKKLTDSGLIVTGKFNRSPYDRTTWYGVTEYGKSIYRKSEIKNAKIGNEICGKSEMRFAENQEPIPNNNTDIITDNNKDILCAKTRFTPPTLEEVSRYAADKGWTLKHFDPERFVDYYTANGWMVGRTRMKDWTAAARGWVAKNGGAHGTDCRPDRESPRRLYDGETIL